MFGAQRVVWTVCDGQRFDHCPSHILFVTMGFVGIDGARLLNEFFFLMYFFFIIIF